MVLEKMQLYCVHTLQCYFHIAVPGCTFEVHPYQWVMGLKIVILCGVEVFSIYWNWPYWCLRGERIVISPSARLLTCDEGNK